MYKAKARLGKPVRGSAGLTAVYRKLKFADKFEEDTLVELSRIGHMLAHLTVPAALRAVHDVKLELSGKARNFFVLQKR